MDWRKFLSCNVHVIVFAFLIPTHFAKSGAYSLATKDSDNSMKNVLTMYDRVSHKSDPSHWPTRMTYQTAADMLRHGTKRNDQVSKFGWGKRSSRLHGKALRSRVQAKRQPNENGWGGAYGDFKSDEKRQNANAWGGAYGEQTEKRQNQNAWGGAYGVSKRHDKRQNANAWGGAYGDASDAEKRQNANAWGGAYGESDSR